MVALPFWASLRMLSYMKNALSKVESTYFLSRITIAQELQDVQF